MAKGKPKIGIIIGTNRPNRIGRQIAEWVQNAMHHKDLELDLIDLAEINLPFLDEPEIPARHHYKSEHTKRWSRLISSYDGFVIVFPQYNWGYPAVLKNALDYLYDEWKNKPVSLMCYGGHGGFQGALALKLVTQGLNMYNMSSNPPLNITSRMFNHQGQFKNINEAFERYKAVMQLTSSEFISLLKK